MHSGPAVDGQCGILFGSARGRFRVHCNLSCPGRLFSFSSRARQDGALPGSMKRRRNTSHGKEGTAVENMAWTGSSACGLCLPRGCRWCAASTKVICTREYAELHRRQLSEVKGEKVNLHDCFTFTDFPMCESAWIIVTNFFFLADKKKHLLELRSLQFRCGKMRKLDVRRKG